MRTQNYIYTQVNVLLYLKLVFTSEGCFMLETGSGVIAVGGERGQGMFSPLWFRRVARC